MCGERVSREDPKVTSSLFLYGASAPRSGKGDRGRVTELLTGVHMGPSGKYP